MMKNNLVRVAAVVLLALIGSADRVGAAVATINLVQSSLNAGSVEFDVEIELQGDTPADFIDLVNLNVAASDPSLTVGGTDFSRFSFNLTFPGWTELVPFDSFGDGTGFFGAIDPIFGPFIEDTSVAGSQVLGVLSVDLAGLTAGDNVLISLAEGGPFGTSIGGLINGIPLDSSLNPQLLQLDFVQPNGFVVTVPASADVPEPSSLLLAAMAVGVVGARRRRRSIA